MQSARFCVRDVLSCEEARCQSAFSILKLLSPRRISFAGNLRWCRALCGSPDVCCAPRLAG
jgi:hypothetical protein